MDPIQGLRPSFYLGIYVGPRATAQEQRALKRLLDGMRIDPR